jgi:4-diphosphocytidyl-2-C-methyl-D-erythritol kinase
MLLLFLMTKMPNLSVLAPAKLNLHLAVGGKRVDGFHNLESIFLALDFGDTLDFEVIPGENAVKIDVISCMGAETQDTRICIPDNIILSAVSLFRQKTGFSKSLKITVKKHIPLGGGLGGGSSDAASTLLALNKITRSMGSSPLSREVLLETGAALGSDVPFFLHEIPAAWVTGRGEYIKPIDPLFDMFFVLVNPGFSSNTATAFKLLDEARRETPAPCFEEQPQLLQYSGLSALKNDFLGVFGEKENAVYNEVISQLLASGADFANLSGAGSTCFGVFREKKQAEKAAENLCGYWSFAKVVELVSKTRLVLEQP